MNGRRKDQKTTTTFQATALEVRDGIAITNWLLAAADLDTARERAREQAARRASPATSSSASSRSRTAKGAPSTGRP